MSSYFVLFQASRIPSPAAVSPIRDGVAAFVACQRPSSQHAGQQPESRNKKMLEHEYEGGRDWCQNVKEFITDQDFRV